MFNFLTCDHGIHATGWQRKTRSNDYEGRLDGNFTEKVRLSKVVAKGTVKFFVNLWTTGDSVVGNVHQKASR